MKKSKLTIEEVKHVASLANLELTNTEMLRFQDQLSAILEYIEKLKKLDTTGVAPVSQVTGKVNEFREDYIENSLTQKEALKNAKRSHNGFFVAKVLWK